VTFFIALMLIVFWVRIEYVNSVSMRFLVYDVLFIILFTALQGTYLVYFADFSVRHNMKTLCSAYIYLKLAIIMRTQNLLIQKIRNLDIIAFDINKCKYIVGINANEEGKV